MNRPGVRSKTTLLFLAVLGLQPSYGQEIRSLGVDTSCNCRILLHNVTRLGRDEDTVAVSAGSVIARDSKGRYYAAPVFPRGAVAVLNAEGKLTSTMGRSGRGPGELGAIRHVRVIRGDSILVFDRERLTLFSPAGVFVRSSRVPDGVVGFRFVVLPDGKVVINNYFPTRPSFALLNQQHALIRGFGRSIARDDFPDSDALQFALVGLDSGRFAAVQRNYAFEIQVWDTTGALKTTFRRNPAWFPAWSLVDARSRGPRSAPFPTVTAAYADLDRRLLWIAATVPDSKWKETPSQPALGERGHEIRGWTPIPISDYQRAFDTVLEVIDLETGRVKVSQRFDEYVPFFLEGGFLYGLRETGSGLYVVDVWRAEVIAQP